MYQLAN